MQRPNMDADPHWDSINIYLFTNGQQNSPPRKFHLRGEQLSRWDSALNTLGQSLYGVRHKAINLFTLSGNKIATPLELVEGGRYVAVETYDTFMQTGYEKYLMKASKSWEKSQSKKIGSAALKTVADSLKGKTDHSKYSMRVEVDTTKQTQIQAQPIKVAGGPRKTSLLVKPQYFAKNRLRSGSFAIADKKRSSSSSRVLSQVGLQKRNSTTKSGLNQPTKRKASPNRKDITGIHNIAENEETNKDQACINKLERELSTSDFYRKPKTMDTGEMDDLIGDKELLIFSNLFPNPQSEAMTVYVEMEKNNCMVHEKDAGKVCCPSCPSCIGAKIDPNEQTNNNGEVPFKPNDGEDCENCKNVQTHCPYYKRKKNCINETQSSDSVMVISPVINLKVYLEIADPGNDENNKNKQQNEAKPIEMEDQGICMCPDMIESDHSLNEEPVHGLGEMQGKNLKIVLFNCNCESTNTEVTERRDQSEYTNNDGVERSAWTSNTEIRTSEKSIQKTESLIIKVNANTQARSSCGNVSLPCTKNTASCLMKTSESNISVCEKKQETKRVSVCESPSGLCRHSQEPAKDIVLMKEYDVMDIQYSFTQIPNCLVKQASDCSCKKPELVDKGTQTEWCDVMLEARLQPDGHYAFHLPPLNAIRDFN